MDPTIRFRFNSGMPDLPKSGHENDGKFHDSEQCDSGIDSYLPSTDSEFRSTSFAPIDENVITTQFSALSVTNPSVDSINDLKTGETELSIDQGYSSIREPSIPEEPVKRNPTVDLTAIYTPDAEGDTFLQLAIIQQKVNLSFDIIQCCADPEFLNFANSNQLTALHLAVLTDQPQITRCLVAYGASLRVKDRQGNTPIHLACELGLVNQLDMLTSPLDDDENPGFRKDDLPLHINERNYNGFSPLHLAVMNNRVGIVWELISKLKCSVNLPDLKSGRTALHHSVESGHTDITLILLKADAHVNALTYDECSPLHLAAARGFKKEAELLLHNNADIFLITRDDYDVFELAAHSKSRRLTAYLRKKEDERRQKKKPHYYRTMN